MIQMTTPVHKFHVDVDLTEAQKISVYYRQGDNHILTLNKTDLTITPPEISHKFSEQETRRFSEGNASVQIKAILKDGTIISHKNPVGFKVYEIYDRRVFGDE